MYNLIGSVVKLLRLIRVALTPRGLRIITRFDDGLVVTGLNKKGYGGRVVYILRDEVEPEFKFLNRFVD
jgi:hypothetical protein